MKMLRISQVLTAVSLLVWAGCEPSPPSPEDSIEEIGSAQVRMVDDTRAAASVKVAAKVAETGKLAAEATIKLQQQSSLDLPLRPGSYVLDVQAFADADAKVLLSARSATVKVAKQAASTVDVKIAADASGAVGIGITGPEVDLDLVSGGTGAGVSVTGGASAGGNVSGGATAGGSASGNAMVGGSASGTGGSTGATAGGNVSATGGSTGAMAGASATLSAPIIEGVDVSIGQTSVKVSVKASASAGGALQFVWSGAGFNGSVSGGASADIDVATILTASTKTTKILVQTKDGLVAQVKVNFDVTGHLLGALKLTGTSSTSIVTAASLAASATACVDVHAQCTATCKASAAASASSVEAHAACMLDCAVKLAICCQ